jgi:hypothetical protein
MTYRAMKDALGWTVRRKDGVFITRGQCESTANRICNELNDCVIKQLNTQSILDDFMKIANEFQYYFKDKNDYKNLDFKDYDELYTISCKARDMLQNMDIELK